MLAQGRRGLGVRARVAPGLGELRPDLPLEGDLLPGVRVLAEGLLDPRDPVLADRLDPAVRLLRPLADVGAPLSSGEAGIRVLGLFLFASNNKNTSDSRSPPGILMQLVLRSTAPPTGFRVAR